MADGFFNEVPERIRFGGLASTEPLAYKVYDPDRLVLGTRMEDHLRPGVCFWHSFAWPGVDMFGTGTLDRPWLTGAGDPMAAARTKMSIASVIIRIIISGRPARRRSATRSIPMPIMNMTTIATGSVTQNGMCRTSNTAMAT